MRHLKLFLLILLFPSPLFAFFCPGNFNQIEFGNSTAQVQQQCGKPDKEETKTQANENVPQEWGYFIPQTVGKNTASQIAGTLKTQVTFDNTGKVINMSVNGIGVGASKICGSQIQLGDSRDKVKSTCGEPSFVDKQNGSPNALGPAQPPIIITTFTYNTSPQVQLIFQNGKLTGKQ